MGRTRDRRTHRPIRTTTDGRLPVDEIVACFMDDLRSAGLDLPEPADPLHDEAWIATLEEAYPSRAPTIPRRER